MSDTQKALYQLTKELADEWAENAEENIRERVNEILNKRIEELVLNLCGFSRNHTYGWQIDHCNGRSGNSPVGNFFKDALQDRIKYLAGKIEIPKAEEERIRKAFIDGYLREYKSEMLVRARRLAKEHAERYAKKISESALDGAAESVRLRMMEANK